MGRASPNNRAQGSLILHPCQRLLVPIHRHILSPSHPLSPEPSLNMVQAPCQIAKQPPFGSRATPPGMTGEVPAPVTTPGGTNRISFASSDLRSRAPTTAEHDAVVTFDDSLWKDVRRQILERLDQSKSMSRTAEFYSRSLKPAMFLNPRSGHWSSDSSPLSFEFSP
ncbi:hypothetical protein CGRA01v4_06668 [Colletotrichum graminicola]|nr:hypothetical protein CGRA01v4_06668 [Colletotrichum graminicola]